MFYKKTRYRYGKQKHRAAQGASMIPFQCDLRFLIQIPRTIGPPPGLPTLEKRGSDFHISDSRPKDVLQGTKLVLTPWLLADTYDICLHSLIFRAIRPGFDKFAPSAPSCITCRRTGLVGTCRGLRNSDNRTGQACRVHFPFPLTGNSPSTFSRKVRIPALTTTPFS